MRNVLFLIACFFYISFVSAQENKINLKLEECIERATAGSLDAFKAKNLYLSGYWGYRSYKAGRLPSISFQFSPMQYTNSITQRYDYNQNIDVYRQQQTLSSSGGVSISQKLDLTGGTFNLNTGLNYLRSVGESVFTNPSRQDVVNIGFTIPIVDWGIRKEQLNMARNNLKATKLPIHSE